MMTVRKFNKTKKDSNFLVYISNKYYIDKRFFIKIKKSKQFLTVIQLGFLHENAIRLTCFSFYSIGKADCIVHFLTNAINRVFQSDYLNEKRCCLGYLA